MRLVLALAVVGCTSAPPTSSLKTDFNAKPSDPQVTTAGKLSVSASFSDDHDQPVTLEDSARVTVVFRGQETTLPRPRGWFAADLDLDSPLVVDEPLTFTLHRDGEPAIAATITAPPVPALDPLPLFISRAANTPFTWTPASDDAMFWLVSGDCIGGYEMLAPNATSSSLTPSALMPGAFTGTCTATLTLQRDRDVPAPAAFAGGGGTWCVRTLAEFASTP